MEPTHSSWRRMKYVFIGLGVGILLTPPTLLLAFISAGGGHGDYLWARVFFPYSMSLLPMLMSMLYGGPPDPLIVSLNFFLLPCVQFSIYGVLIGVFASTLKKAARVAAIIGIVHAVAVAACFIIAASYEAKQAAAHAAYVKKYDTDGDGKLSPEECRVASREAVLAAEAEFVKEHDTDGDGKLSPEERDIALHDTDGDGKVSPGERRW